MLILPLCSIYRHGGHDGWSARSLDITFKGNPLRMIQAKLGLNWPSGFRGEDFIKSLDGRRTPSDGNSSYRWAKNCSVGRSWQAEHVCSFNLPSVSYRSWHVAHFCNLNLTSISYSFWNIRWKVLKLKKKIDEKKGNNSKIYFKIAG